MFNNGGLSAGDALALMNGNNNRNNGWGDDGYWWIILFALFGWGGNGFGWGGNNGTQAGFTDAALQAGFNNQSVINKLDGINNGLCSLGYDQLSQMNGINTNIMQTGFGLQAAINSLSAQLAQCCCENREAISQVRYDMATNTCALQNAMTQGFNEVNLNIERQFCNSQMREMQQKIDEQASLIQSLNLAQSQANQNTTLINALRPSPVPAYNVPNPWGYGYNWNSGCGCGNTFSNGCGCC